MPRDYDLMAKAVSGLMRGRAGKIAGAPEGVQKGGAQPSMTTSGSGKRREGVLEGMPVGIMGTVRRTGSASKGRMGAVRRMVLKVR
jgi:hypothetical protein